ncbi:MAG: hypothetical protein RL026_1097, partial [Pseudomonadota bacterium]
MILRLLYVMLGLAVSGSSLMLLAHTDLEPPHLRVTVAIEGATLVPADAPDMPPASQTIAYGEAQVWRVLPEFAGSEPAAQILLTTAPIHVRRSDLMDLADLTEALPELKLQGREDISLRTEGTVAQRWAAGRLDDKPAFQACLVPGLSAATADTQHEPLEQAVVLSQPPVALRQLRQVLGLMPS